MKLFSSLLLILPLATASLTLTGCWEKKEEAPMEAPAEGSMQEDAGGMQEDMGAPDDSGDMGDEHGGEEHE